MSKSPNDRSRKRKLLFLILFLTGVLCWGLILFHFSPLGNKWYPPCPFKLLTGLYCPGCGATRASYNMIHGKFIASLRYHPMVLPMTPIMIFLFIRYFCQMFTGREYRVPGLRSFVFLLLILFILFGVLRNIPLECFELLRPLPI